MQGKDIGRLLVMAASLEKAAVKEWLGSLGDQSNALEMLDLPESVSYDAQQHFSSLTLSQSSHLAE